MSEAIKPHTASMTIRPVSVSVVSLVTAIPAAGRTPQHAEGDDARPYRFP